MTSSSAHGYFVRRFDFQGRDVTCVATRKCETPSAFQIGWKFTRTVKGKVEEAIATRSACERHARFFAAKKGLIFPKVTV